MHLCLQKSHLCCLAILEMWQSRIIWKKACCLLCASLFKEKFLQKRVWYWTPALRSFAIVCDYMETAFFAIFCDLRFAIVFIKPLLRLVSIWSHTIADDREWKPALIKSWFPYDRRQSQTIDLCLMVSVQYVDWAIPGFEILLALHLAPIQKVSSSTASDNDHTQFLCCGVWPLPPPPTN